MIYYLVNYKIKPIAVLILTENVACYYYYFLFQFTKLHKHKGKNRKIYKLVIIRNNFIFLFKKKKKMYFTASKINSIKKNTLWSALGTVIESPITHVFWASRIVFITSWVMQSTSYRKLVGAKGGYIKILKWNLRIQDDIYRTFFS